MTYIQDPTGNQVPAGRVTRTLVDWSPGWTPMPSTLTVDSGAGTVLTPSSSTGQLKLSGSSSRLRARTASDLDMAQFAEISWTVQGYYGNSATGMAPAISIENDTGTLGAAFYQADTDSTARLRLGQPSGPAIVVYSQYNLGGQERLNHRNLTLQIRPPSGEVRVLADDQVVFELPPASRSSLVLGLARCCALSTVTSTSQALFLSRLWLAVSHS